MTLWAILEKNVNHPFDCVCSSLSLTDVKPVHTKSLTPVQTQTHETSKSCPICCSILPYTHVEKHVRCQLLVMLVSQ